MQGPISVWYLHDENHLQHRTSAKPWKRSRRVMIRSVTSTGGGNADTQPVNGTADDVLRPVAETCCPEEADPVSRQQHWDTSRPSFWPERCLAVLNLWAVMCGWVVGWASASVGKAGLSGSDSWPGCSSHLGCTRSPRHDTLAAAVEGVAHKTHGGARHAGIVLRGEDV